MCALDPILAAGPMVPAMISHVAVQVAPLVEELKSMLGQAGSPKATPKPIVAAQIKSYDP
jgi:hypothetical protein